MKKVSKRARPIRTWEGGAVGVPMALRSIESTTTMRVKEVISTKIDGAKERMVIRTRSCTPVLTCSGPPPGSMLKVSPGADSSCELEQPVISSDPTRIMIKADFAGDFIPVHQFPVQLVRTDHRKG